MGVIERLREQWVHGVADREDLVELLRVLTTTGLGQADPVFVAAVECLSSSLQGVDDYRAVAMFVQEFPSGLHGDVLERVKAEYVRFIDDVPVDWDDSDGLRQVAADLEFAGERLGVDVQGIFAGMYERADERDAERSEGEQDDATEGWVRSSLAEDDIDAMFEGLRLEVERGLSRGLMAVCHPFCMLRQGQRRLSVER